MSKKKKDKNKVIENIVFVTAILNLIYAILEITELLFGR